ncbi:MULTISPECIES: neutral zinc metallopeptidase [unclassified Nocardioides]|uniref:neutral zinc metallopeptidase n=1 Tax=unclassified Nocardioides TaxID=2615069 RepID=UPI0007027A9C|nr:MULTISPECIES: neutral zinc metallopeptidase [unclassified Nocardioides]KRC53186.1 peptidase [Nocardioides sp. Root79]KRC72714.1 peptidase [Nocardioides sp. Root240]
MRTALTTLPVLLALGLLAGCGGGGGGTASTDEKSSDPTASPAAAIEISGDASAPVNALAIKAIGDLQSFWKDAFPTLYGTDYTDVDGGLYALTPDSTEGPECASSYADVQGNAFYCKLDDSVAWDADELLPDLREKYGDFVIPIVLAHEWGHALQQRSGFFDQNQLTVSSELQADCFAGAWAQHAQESGAFDVTAADLDTALAGILDLRDTPGTNSMDPSAHGSGFDRVSAFQDGFDQGVARCKGHADGEPAVLELPFNDAADEARGGDAPYDQIISGVPYDLEDFWSQLYPELADGERWTPLKGYEPFDPANAPPCGDADTSTYVLFYCVPDDYVGFDNVTDMPRIYEQGGDYAVATLLATQWGLAALARAGVEVDEKEATRITDCFAGGYTASVILHNRAKTSSYSISPGDLDEGIKALLVFRGPGDSDRQGAGYDRVKAFRQGVLDGASSCLR